MVLHGLGKVCRRICGYIVEVLNRSRKAFGGGVDQEGVCGVCVLQIREGLWVCVRHAAWVGKPCGEAVWWLA